MAMSDQEHAERGRDDQQFDSNDNSWFCYFFVDSQMLEQWVNKEM
jgi:hypothetical protein